MRFFSKAPGQNVTRENKKLQQHQQEDALAACSRALTRSASASIPSVGMSLVHELLAQGPEDAAAASSDPFGSAAATMGPAAAATVEPGPATAGLHPLRRGCRGGGPGLQPVRCH